MPVCFSLVSYYQMAVGILLSVALPVQQVLWDPKLQSLPLSYPSWKQYFAIWCYTVKCQLFCESGFTAQIRQSYYWVLRSKPVELNRCLLVHFYLLDKMKKVKRAGNSSNWTFYIVHCNTFPAMLFLFLMNKKA